MPVDLPRFDVGEAKAGASSRRGVPARRVAGQLVTTVFDLMLAQYGVGRPGLPGEWPTGYDDPEHRTRPPGRRRSPAVPADRRPGSRGSSPTTPSVSGGRSMIAMGAGTNHWFHSDADLPGDPRPGVLTGCQGVNGGGWAHYVGQEKCRPLTGWTQLAFASGLDAAAPPDGRHVVLVPGHRPVALRRVRGGRTGHAARPRAVPGRALADCIAQATRLGWTPSYPDLRPQPT